MADKKQTESAIPFLKWSGKGGSGISTMHDRDEKGNTVPWSGERLAEELNSHTKAGNTVTFGAIHRGQVIGEAKPAAKKTTRAANMGDKSKDSKAVNQSAKPSAKKVDKPAAKSVAKPSAKPVAKPSAKKDK